jgi:HK97 family phage major capsid protein
MDEDLVLPEAIKTVDDSKRVISAIKSVAKDLADRDSRDANVQKACDDLQKAVQVLQTKFDAQSAPAEIVGANEGELKRYINPDGSFRMVAEEVSFEFAGKTYKTVMPGFLDDLDRACSFQKEAQDLVQQRAWARLAQKNGDTPWIDSRLAYLFSRAPSVNGFRSALEAHCKQINEAQTADRRKAFTNTSGSGADWIPTAFIPDLYEALQVRGDVLEQFKTVTVGSASFIRPRVSNSVRLYIVTNITSDTPANYTASTPGTSQQTYTIPMGGVRVLVDLATSEDSAIAAIPQLQRLMGDTRNDAMSDAILNGDTTATHQDAIASWNLRARWGSTGLGGTADHRRLWKGGRRQSVDRSTTLDMGSIQTAAGILQLISLLGERGAGSLGLFTSPEVVIQKLMALAEVITIDKMGAMATIVKGQIASLFGHPIIMTRWMGADLAATGLYTGSGSKSGLLAMDTSGYYRYQARGVIIEVQKIISSQHIELVMTIREGFDTPDDSTAKNVAYGYNWL